jgi:hypothetical protein
MVLSTSKLVDVCVPLKLILALRRRRDFAPMVRHRLERECPSGGGF